MKIWIVILLPLLLFPTVSGQDDPYGEPVMSKKELRSLAKEKKIAERLAEEEKMKEKVSNLIESRRFVLEADFIAGRTGNRQSVNSLLNFIVVDSLQGIVQIGTNRGLGYNGVGGITIDGDITKYDVSEKVTKRGTTYSIDMYLNSARGNYDIHLWISSTGNAEATVRGLYSGSLTFSGEIVAKHEARIFKGSSM